MRLSSPRGTSQWIAATFSNVEPAAEQRFQAFEKRLNVMAGRASLQRGFAKVPVFAKRLQVHSQPRGCPRIARIQRVEPMRAFEDGRRPRHAGLGEPCRKEPGVRRPARVQGLHCRALVRDSMTPRLPGCRRMPSALVRSCS